MDQKQTSKVVHFQNVPATANETELLSAVSRFGTVARHVILRSKQQALVEMGDVRSAINLINFYASTPCKIGGQTVSVGFSNHQELDRWQQPARPAQASTPKRVLLVTVHDCVYPMTVDVVHQVFSPHGPVEKIVVFTKPSGVRVLVQYSNVDAATHALEVLQGQHVYVGVCKLQIQYSKHDDLNVTRNNEHTRDYLNPHLPSDSPALLPTPSPSRSPQIPPPPTNPLVQTSPLHHQNPHHQNQHIQLAAPHLHLAQRSPVSAYQPAPPVVPGKSVLLLSNLNSEQTTCTSLFNLFSVYGNVVRIKMFFNKPQHAMVQMASPNYALAAIQNLKGCKLFGNIIDVVLSKHESINQSLTETTGESAKLFADFTNSKQNRFRVRPDGTLPLSKHMYPPSSTLHISNIAAATTLDSLKQKFSEHGTITVSKLFEVNEHPMCLLQFQTTEQAVTALALLHGTVIDGHTLRVAFARLPVDNGNTNTNQNGESSAATNNRD